MGSSWAYLGWILAALALASAPSRPVFAQSEFDDEFGDTRPSVDTGRSGNAVPAEGPASPAPEVREPPMVSPGDAAASFDSEFGAENPDGRNAGSEPAVGAAAGGEQRPTDAATEPTLLTPDDEEVLPPESLRSQAFRASNTILGATGGVRLVDARPAQPSSFRVQLATEFFLAQSFLNGGDTNNRLGGTLSLSYGIHEYVEVFASVAAQGNFNDREDPEILQTLGDTVVGAKAGAELLPWLFAGGDLSLAFLNTVGDIGLVFAGTSVGLRGNLTADFRRYETWIPLIARLNVQYYFDNSANLVEDVEIARYNGIPPLDRLPFPDETRNLLSRVERFALGINRTDFLNVGLGLESPLRVMKDFYVHPLLEWNWHIPINRQAYECTFFAASPGSDAPAPGEDGCLLKQGLASFPMRLTVGVRVQPPVRGLTALAAVDVGLTGVSTFVRELAPTAPYNVILALSYAYDTEPEAAPPVIQQVERRVELPGTLGGRIVGTAVDQSTGLGISDVVVGFANPALTRLLTASDGTFTSYPLPVGATTLALSHPDYEASQCPVTVEDAQEDVTVRCAMVAAPRRGTIVGHVLNEAGAGVAAALEFIGPTPRTANSEPGGTFSVEDLEAGAYIVHASADDYLIRAVPVTVEPRAQSDVRIELVPKPRRSLVRLQGRAIQILRQVNFATDSGEILPASFTLLAEVADLLIRNPQLRRVEVQGHTDNRGRANRNLELSDQRAQAVREWLIHHGVDEGRLTAQGYGMNRPLVPNITAGNRAKNRRVQFVILEQE